MSSFKKPFSLAAKQPGTSPPAQLPDEKRPRRIAITVDHDETRLPVSLIASTIH
ncbi:MULTISPECIES: hypothetical protein [unclassified Rhizobium]|uniref:hypothetical protein n=1 Tax=unclassified Rhizobium TaxID=2613769 RepID=UPI001AD97684|nr:MULTISPECIES: hypothetical protein [unclassified Rhizobium]MBO9124641.1 hypothetical protein [Rhizobium sp. 16-488-2b]MBO9175225.1 hypothetical protein [Rhizobium sp. 16-488-2a]